MQPRDLQRRMEQMPRLVQGFLAGNGADRAAWLAERLFWTRLAQEPCLVLTPLLNGLRGIFHPGEPYWACGFVGSVRLDPVRELMQAPAPNVGVLAREFARTLIPKTRSMTAREPFWEDSARTVLESLFAAGLYRYVGNLAPKITKEKDSSEYLLGPQETATAILLQSFSELSEGATLRQDSRGNGTLPWWTGTLPKQFVQPLQTILARNSLITAGSVLSVAGTAMDTLRELAPEALHEQCDRVFHPEKLRGPLFVGVENLSAEVLGLLLLAARRNGISYICAADLDQWSQEHITTLIASKTDLAWTAERPVSHLDGLLAATRDLSWGYAADSANRMEFSNRVLRTTGLHSGLLTSMSYEEPAQLPDGLSLRHDGVQWRIDPIPKEDEHAIELVLEEADQAGKGIPFLEILAASDYPDVDDEDVCGELCVQ